MTRKKFWLSSSYQPHAKIGAIGHAKGIRKSGYKAKVTRNKKTGYYHVWTSKSNPYTKPKLFGRKRRKR